MNKNNSYALITGGGSGIGAAIAQGLAQQGLKVVIVGRQASKLISVASQYPEQIIALTADLSSLDGVNTLLAELPQGDYRYLVHNAGMVSPLGSLLTVPVEQWEQCFHLNVRAPLALTQGLVPLMTKGRILHLSSQAAHQALSGMGAYCVSKSALYMVYQALRQELPDGIAIGSVMPGIVDTPMQTQLQQADTGTGVEQAFYQDLKTNNQLIAPDVVAKFLIWLLTEVPATDYSKQEWDIYDDSHHHAWLGEQAGPCLELDS